MHNITLIEGTVSGTPKILNSRLHFSLETLRGRFHIQVPGYEAIRACQTLAPGQQVYVMGELASFLYKKCRLHHAFVEAKTVISGDRTDEFHQLMRLLGYPVPPLNGNNNGVEKRAKDVLLEGSVVGRPVYGDDGSQFSLTTPRGVFHVKVPGQLAVHVSSNVLKPGDAVFVAGEMRSNVWRQCNSHHIFVTASMVIQTAQFPAALLVLLWLGFQGPEFEGVEDFIRFTEMLRE